MNSKEEEERGVPLDRAEEKCCGEQMQPILRYKEEGVVMRLFECINCGRKVSL